MNKATIDVAVKLSNLSYIKTLLKSIMWVRSYRTENLTRFGGVAHMLGWPTCWWNTLFCSLEDATEFVAA
jgi:hypothetical protein